MAEKKTIFMLLSLITGFVFLLSFSSYYVKDAIDKGNVCGCAVPIPLMLVLLGSLGLFVGSLVSYFLFRHFEQNEQKQLRKKDQPEVLFCLFAPEERKIIKALVKGKQRQSALADQTGLSRVKVHRIVERLAQKGILKKEEDGVSLVEEIQQLLC